MKLEEINDIKEAVGEVLYEAVALKSENAFLRRVLRQAVLTHGGELKIDPALAPAAEAERHLEFGNGGVRFLD